MKPTDQLCREEPLLHVDSGRKQGTKEVNTYPLLVRQTTMILSYPLPSAPTTRRPPQASGCAPITQSMLLPFIYSSILPSFALTAILTHAAAFQLTHHRRLRGRHSKHIRPLQRVSLHRKGDTANRGTATVFRQHQINVHTTGGFLETEGDDGTNHHDEWDMQLRQEAVDALLPVFFPKSIIPNTSSDECISTKKITAEASLKKLLRKRYQRTSKDDDLNNTIQSKYTDDEARGRLAKLVLGTSVLRLRHYYVVASRYNMSSREVTLPYPGDDSVRSLLLINNEKSGDDDVQTNEQSEEEAVVRAMIDEHAKYLSVSSYLPVELTQINADTPAINLAIQYSLPTFLTTALVSQYGYSMTQRICSFMNDPGPVTIRKNCVRFSGSDEELCKWLWEEDGVQAVPLSVLLESKSEGVNNNDNKLQLTAQSNGGALYALGGEYNVGSVRAPNGCIQILPPEQSTFQQKKLSKSIWSMRGWQNGYFEVQDAGSQCIVQSLEVSPGDYVLDYCAGNGGKTFGLASVLMDTNRLRRDDPDYSDEITSHIVAHDVVEERLRQVEGSLSRVGFEDGDPNDLSTITSYSAGCEASNDGSRRLRCSIQIASSTEIESESSHFDAVLVDAPCSSTGVLRRRPSQRWDIRENQVLDVLPKLQLEILQRAASFVKEGGGKLVYSTCSMLKEENESVCRLFEESDAYAEHGFQRWGFDNRETNSVTLLPTSNSDGFFIARWKRL